VLDSNYSKVLFTIDLMKMICICIYEVFENIYVCKKGFSIDLIKMSLKMLGQKSIKSCYVPFASSKSIMRPRIYLRVRILM